MTNNEIITNIANVHLVERLVNRVQGGVFTEDSSDLCQYIYMTLFQMNNERLDSLYSTNKLRYFIVGIITRQVFSRNSQFYKYHNSWNQRKSQLDESYERIPDGED